MYSLKNLNKQQFLDSYWQKKPLVIQQGFSDFIDPLDENDLAGLGLEQNIDSRIVSQQNNQWQVTHGPFADINAHCVGAWSLLVQSVDHMIPEADELMRAFDFIPHWRMDDLMVSFSNQGAGVGPHLDQYDVFIVQGKGKRRWQVGLPDDFTTFLPHPDLCQISGFEAVIDQVLHPGDILYIPAGHPHNGVALSDCMNYSVGFRAPTQQEMLSSLADHALEHQLFNQRYTDKDLKLRATSGEIKQQEVTHFRQLFHDLIDSDQFSLWLGQFLSHNGQKYPLEEHDLASYSHDFIKQKLLQGEKFYRAPGIKAVFVEQDQSNSQYFSFYIQGESFEHPIEEQDLVINLLNSSVFYDKVSKKQKFSLFFTQTLTTLVNSGYWYLEDV